MCLFVRVWAFTDDTLEEKIVYYYNNGDKTAVSVICATGTSVDGSANPSVQKSKDRQERVGLGSRACTVGYWKCCSKGQ